MNVPEAVTQYLASLEAERRSPHTINAYRRDLAAFVAYAGDLDLNAVTPALLQRFMASDGVQLRPCGARRAKSTVNRYRVTLKGLFAWAVARWLVKRNPTRILKCKRPRSAPPVILTGQEIQHLHTFTFTGRHAPRDHALIDLLLSTGCRIGETMALDINDLDLDSGTVELRITKGDAPDRIPLSHRCIISVETYLQSDSRISGPVFTTSTGRRLSVRQAQRIVEARIHEAGIAKHITPHSLRHTFATRLYNRTGDIRLVQRALRHEFITTTQVYAHIDPQRLRDTVNNMP